MSSTWAKFIASPDTSLYKRVLPKASNEIRLWALCFSSIEGARGDAGKCCLTSVPLATVPPGSCGGLA